MIKKVKIIYIGYAVDPMRSSEFSGISIAGNMMQVNILRELNKIKEIELHVISVRPVATYPRDKKIFYRGNKGLIDKSISTNEVPFINIPVIKQFSQCISVESRLDKELQSSDISNTVVFTFNMFPQIGIPAVRMMKKYGVRTVSLLADLPIDDAIGRKGISKWLREQFNNSTRESILALKDIIVLNKHAAEKYAPTANYIVIDGGVNKDTISKYVLDFSVRKKKRNMVYGGSLNHYSGILTLARAMQYIQDKDIFLDIYGSGDGELELMRMAQRDSRIHMLGRVDNETMLQKQREAYLLINPRPTDDPISQVTFPSKIFEYMLSGTPIISTRLNGFTNDYNEKMFYFEEYDEYHFAEVILEVMGRPYDQLLERAQRAYHFVSTERLWNIQAKIIVDYLCEGLEGKIEGAK